MRVLPGMATSLAVAGLLMCTAQGFGARSESRQAESASEASASVFRLDGGNVTYAVGVTKQGSVQTVYWGARLAPNDPLPTAHPVGRAFEMDDSPQEFAGWGGGMTSEPSLKIGFPDGNRDLVLRFVRRTRCSTMRRRSSSRTSNVTSL